MSSVAIDHGSGKDGYYTELLDGKLSSETMLDVYSLLLYTALWAEAQSLNSGAQGFPRDWHEAAQYPVPSSSLSLQCCFLHQGVCASHCWWYCLKEAYAWSADLWGAIVTAQTTSWPRQSFESVWFISNNCLSLVHCVRLKGNLHSKRDSEFFGKHSDWILCFNANWIATNEV